MQIFLSQEKQGLDNIIYQKFFSFFFKMSGFDPASTKRPAINAIYTVDIFVDVLLVACIFSLFAGTAAPEVNESHYLVKAKHFWDPEFALGDLFAESHDAHWFFFLTLGWLTNIMPLGLAAWVGRVLGWGVLALGWCVLVQGVFPRLRHVGPLTIPFWITAQHCGQLSGEWVVGGFESKVFAYGFAFLGLTGVLCESWLVACFWFGISSAFHILTGGWIWLAAFIAWGLERILWKNPDKFPWRKCFGGLIIGCVIALPGLLPALCLNGGTDAVTSEKAAMIYVYQRLPHHLSPLHFDTKRWLAFSCLLGFTAVVWSIHRRQSLSQQKEVAKSSHLSIPEQFRLDAAAMLDRKPKKMGMIALVVLGFGVIGLCIDVFVSSWATNWSASLLRYYWFRWIDVIWPTLLTLLVTAIAWNSKASKSESSSSIRDKSHVQERILRWLALAILLIPGPCLIAWRYVENYRAILTPSDKAAMMPSRVPTEQKKLRDDWLDACSWIKANTPSGSVFLTPRLQQTFKWYAERAEVVSWKDTPQDAASIVEWEKRLLDVLPRSTEGFAEPLTNERVRELRKKYRFDYILVDRRVQKRPLLLPLVFSSDNYVLFEWIE